MGTWYGISNTFNTFQLGTKCARAEYSQSVDTAGSPITNRINVRNTGFYTLLPSVQTEAKGYAEPFDAQKAPNKLRLLLTPQLLGYEIMTGSEGKYFVIDTDYRTYSIVYSCTETNLLFFTVKEEFAFVLSRTKRPSNTTIELVNTKLSAYIDVKQLIQTEQDCDN